MASALKDVTVGVYLGPCCRVSAVDAGFRRRIGNVRYPEARMIIIWLMALRSTQRQHLVRTLDLGLCISRAHSVEPAKRGHRGREFIKMSFTYHPTHTP